MPSQHYYAAIKKRAFPSKAPDKPFDPLTAKPDELEYYGLPQPPDALADPEGYAFWHQLLSPPFKIVAPEFPQTPELFELDERCMSLPPSIAKVAATYNSFAHREISWNWSGAYITPLHPLRFTAIIGCWRVPTVTMPKTLPHTRSPIDVLKSSAWIGLNGHRSRLPKASMPQIGTNHYISTAGGQTTVKYGAWWQWWKAHPDSTDPENELIPIENFQVEPGDEIMSGMIVTASQDVLFYIKNQTKGQFSSFIAVAPGAIDPIGATAEWIFERPTDPHTGNLYALPNYGSVEFTYCLAYAAAQPLSAGIVQSLQGNARYINMRETFANPERSALVSVTSKRTSTSVLCRFYEPGRTS